MTRTLAVEEEIQMPASEVWKGLTDWENANRWMPGVEGMAADGETAEGTKLVFHARGKERSSTIVHCDAGTSIVLRSTQGGVTADYRYEVHDIDGRSSPRHVGGRLSCYGALVADRLTTAPHRHPFH